MVGKKIPQNFSECLEFFGVPDFEYEMLSSSEKLLVRICYKVFIEGVLEFDPLNLYQLDERNQEKLAKLVKNLLGI